MAIYQLIWFCDRNAGVGWEPHCTILDCRLLLPQLTTWFLQRLLLQTQRARAQSVRRTANALLLVTVILFLRTTSYKTLAKGTSPLLETIRNGFLQKMKLRLLRRRVTLSSL
jgi:hypothetical protein